MTLQANEMAQMFRFNAVYVSTTVGSCSALNYINAIYPKLYVTSNSLWLGKFFSGNVGPHLTPQSTHSRGWKQYGINGNPHQAQQQSEVGVMNVEIHPQLFWEVHSVVFRPRGEKQGLTQQRFSCCTSACMIPCWGVSCGENQWWQWPSKV